ncbi:MAG: hypothetical protein NTV79_10555 [Candidatus Aureabacteria bacterium]|nr:hypothetical protein [Candidatus Auribacterota bacterium]
MSASDNNKRGRLNRWLGRLINRRLTLWLASLAVIAVLLAALGAIFWQTRMKATYEASLAALPQSGVFRLTFPRESLQKILPGDGAAVDLGEGRIIAGRVESVDERGNEVEIVLRAALGDSLPARVRITLRAKRLVAAFRRGG